MQVVDRDRYGRTVGVVLLRDGRSLSHELVRAGLAWMYRRYTNDQSLSDLEEEARVARRGLWADPEPVPPWECQGRFKSFPVQTDEHFLTVARYVERNALRAKLVRRAEDWRWSSLWRREQRDGKLRVFLSEWPVGRPSNWVWRLNQPETAAELEVLRCSVQRGRPFGNERWQGRIATRLGLESTLRARGRPKRS